MACDRYCRIAQPGFDAERNQLDGGDHLAFDHRLEGGKRCERDRFIDAVDAIDRRTIHHQNAATATPSTTASENSVRKK